MLFRSAALLQAVVDRTADLIAHWQAVGFCHGVMNTDNMSILGLTLDYGPFQFMDAFAPGHICNHTDVQGRYAFARQPKVAHWNLHALGQALMALVDDADAIWAVLQTYAGQYENAWLEEIRTKLGLIESHVADLARIQDLYRWMAKQACDHTIFWRRLSHAVNDWQSGLPTNLAFAPVTDLAPQDTDLSSWLDWYRHRISQGGRSNAGTRMLRVNPKYVLRNHMAESVIRSAQSGDFEPVRKLLRVLQNPYDEHPAHAEWADFPPEWAQHIEISCSS